jgi:hypothetical protein
LILERREKEEKGERRKGKRGRREAKTVVLKVRSLFPFWREYLVRATGNSKPKGGTVKSIKITCLVVTRIHTEC